MIEIRIASTADPMADRCAGCGDRWSEPDPVQAQVFDDGVFTGFNLCGTCRFLSEGELRAALLEHADRLLDTAVMLTMAAQGEIRRPPTDALVLEYWWRQSEPATGE